MPKITISSNKIALISDIHWGKSRDSSIKIKITEDFIDFLIKTLKSKKIKDILFLGDWFDNRNAISVKTYNHSYNTLKKLSENDFNVYMIVGNHDAYFKESIDINSLIAFSEIPNIFPIIEITELEFTKSKRIGLCYPWGTLKIEDNINRVDVIFGHFDLKNAQLAGNVNFSGLNMSELSDKCNLIFSGHFHINREYEQRNGKIITIGCPFELDWGDYQNPKGFYILNTSNLSYEFHENTSAPKHIKLYWSSIKNKEFSTNLIKGNFIKLVIDSNYKFEQIIKLGNIINQYQPIRPCETEFIFNKNLNALSEFDGQIDTSIKFSTKLEYIYDFIEKNAKDLNIEKLKTMAKNYYESENQ